MTARARPSAGCSASTRRPRTSEPSGPPLGPPFLVDSDTASEQRSPSVGAAAGAFVVAWNGQTDKSGYGIFAKRYPGPGDINGDGKVDVLDVFYLINFLFAG